MHILITAMLIYYIIGIGVVTYAVRMELNVGIKPDFAGILIGLLVWPVLVVFEYYSQSTARKIDRLNNSVKASNSTKADFGPGHYEGVKNPYAFLDDVNDQLDNSGYYDDRHFAKAALERKKD